MIFSNNPKAYFDYFIEKKLECSIILFANEVKSIRRYRSNLKGSFCMVDNKGVYTNFHIGLVDDPNRVKTILCTKKERKDMIKYISNSGNTLVPLEVYQTDKTVIKLIIGFAKGKKLYDKRNTIKERDLKRYGDG